MAVPKKRHTKSRRNRRRSHLALKKKNLSSCPKCGEPILS
ncbi:MAG: 50S ribosomal protein L32, partial [Patescibacteria group bacterium]